mgnify:CR=1 FL=1
MAIKLPEIDPRYYTYIGVACAGLGFVFILLAILSILGILNFGLSLLWIVFSGAGILFMALATVSFHRIGGKKLPV